MKFYIDTHAHLNDERFRNLEEIIQNSINENVKRIFCVGYDIESSKKAIEIAKNFEIVYAIVGIHPNNISDEISEIEYMIDNEKVIGIGEIGLDFYWNKFSEKEQINAFEKQLKIAQNYSLPVILHLRDIKNSFKVFDIALEILKNYNLKSVVFHSFSGNEEIAEKVLERNYYISFSGSILYKNPHIQKALKITKLRNVFFETDSPYLIPPGLNENINQPKNVKLVYMKASEILNLSIYEVIEKAFFNINNCFNLKEKEFKIIFEWIYDNEALTQNLSDEEAEQFYKNLEYKIENYYNDGFLISQIKRRILER
ncbi:MAG: TatD family hydrolase [candidate division WOR-3 bacterium]